MPHAVEEDEGIRGFLGDEDLSQIPDLNDLNDRDLDLGEKANDAEDYGDISDEDLADDETEIKQDVVSDSYAAEHDPFDELFVDAELGSPSFQVNDEDLSFDNTQLVQDSIEQPSLLEVDLEDEEPEAREQRLLFEQAQREREERRRRTEAYGDVPPPPVTDAELFSAIWPQFEPDKPPRFGELLPGKKAYYSGRKPLKPPKPLNLTKTSLEIQQDQEKSFKLPAPPQQSFQARRAEAETRGIVLIADTEPARDVSEDEDDFNVLEAPDAIGGVTWQDLVALCQNWDLPNADEGFDELFSDADEYGNGVGSRPCKRQKTTHDMSESLSTINDFSLFNENLDKTTAKRFHADMDDEDDGISRPSKIRKIKHFISGPLSIINDFNFAIDDPEKATAKLAKKVHLDLNDPHMLVDIQQPSTSPSHKRKFKRDAAGGLTKDLSSRYNISNDEAYELLKENHQNKIRSLFGNVKIEHSLPALKLQYPFYKVTLSRTEARSWHRPVLALQTAGYVVFSKPAFHKKKHIKGRSVTDLFQTCHDLSIADNSNLLLLEYSEEYPMLMSTFGMGSRLVNYYRRKDDQDTSRPKLDVGETSVLLPQDRSPFAKWGNVDPGQIVPAISNEMYRAPLFQHRPNQRDFIVSRNTTSLEGPKWSMRNVENLHVVGQQLPSVEVPGPNARKVTDAAKHRHKMFGLRMTRKGQRVTNDVVIRHNPGWDVGTARTKMRELMDYDKTNMTWYPRGNDGKLDEPEIRAMLKPNDVSLLYATQVGDRQLQDAGYNDDNFDEDNPDQSEENKPDRSLEEKLVPWQITKNFVVASQDIGMLALHGEGDPTGRGEALSFIRTSMKGGFREIGESIEDRLDAKKQKELGGHKYNVAKQGKAYAAAIRRVWDAQSRSLSSTVEVDDADIDMEDEGESAVDRGYPSNSALGKLRRDDESASVMSRSSSVEQSGKVLRITRTSRDKYGKEEVKQELVHDPKIIRQYLKSRRNADVESLSFDQMKRTGDPEKDAASLKIMKGELERLNRNKDRRHVREKAKGIDAAGSPDASAMSPGANDDNPSGTPKRRNMTGMTARKCANCGQVGHIKTNKKLCTFCLYMSTPINRNEHVRVVTNSSSISRGGRKSGKKV